VSLQNDITDESSHDCTLTLCTETKWSYPDNMRNRKCVVFDTFTWREKKGGKMVRFWLSVLLYLEIQIFEM